MGATKKIEFIVSPTGVFGLAYSVGEQGTFDAKQADDLIDSGYAKLASESKETADTDKAASEKK